MNIILIVEVKIPKLLNDYIGPFNYDVDCWTKNNSQIKKTQFNIFWAHVSLVFGLTSTPHHAPLKHTSPFKMSQWTGRTNRQLQMNSLSLRNDQLKFKS
jgi:hypothetical protein